MSNQKMSNLVREYLGINYSSFLLLLCLWLISVYELWSGCTVLTKWFIVLGIPAALAGITVMRESPAVQLLMNLN